MAKVSCKACKFASWMKVHQCSWVNCSRSQTVSVQQLRRPQCHVQKFFSLSPGPLRNGTSCHQRQQQQALLTLLCQGPLKKHQLLFLHNAAPHSNKIINLISLYRKRTHFFIFFQDCVLSAYAQKIEVNDLQICSQNIQPRPVPHPFLALHTATWCR